MTQWAARTPWSSKASSRLPNSWRSNMLAFTSTADRRSLDSRESLPCLRVFGVSRLHMSESPAFPNSLKGCQLSENKYHISHRRLLHLKIDIFPYPNLLHSRPVISICQSAESWYWPQVSEPSFYYLGIFGKSRPIRISLLTARKPPFKWLVKPNYIT